MTDDQAVERGARALADEYYGVGWGEASDRHDNLRSEARIVLEAATELSEWDCPNCGAVTRAQMVDHPTPTDNELAEAEVIARGVSPLNPWAKLIMDEYDRMRTELAGLRTINTGQHKLLNDAIERYIEHRTTCHRNQPIIEAATALADYRRNTPTSKCDLYEENLLVVDVTTAVDNAQAAKNRNADA